MSVLRAIPLAAVLVIALCTPGPLVSGGRSQGGYYFVAGEYPAVRGIGRDSLVVSQPENVVRAPNDVTVYGPFRTRFSARRAMRGLQKRLSPDMYFSQIFKL